ncbi:UNVERIFIED_CONTAM: hypothetical protein FKN15_038202 [Acipenser sinensis]
MAAEQEAEETVSQDLHSSSELRIVLLGGRCAGKSSSRNTILGRKEFKSGIISSEVTRKCKKRTGEVAGRWVTVFDTPGTVRVEIERCVSLSVPGPHAFLLVIPVYSKYINDIQSDEYWKAVVKHLCESFDKVEQLFGERAMRNTMILFTRGDYLEGKTIEQHIDEAGEEFQQRRQHGEGKWRLLPSK